MRIEIKQMQELEQMARKADISALKELDQTERKAIKVMMQALQMGKESIEIEGFGPKRLEALDEKLKMRIQKNPGTLLERLKKALANVFTRISSSHLKKEIARVEEVTTSRYQRMDRIDQEVLQAEEKIIGFIDRLKLKDAFPKSFSEDLMEAKSQIKELGDKVKGEKEIAAFLNKLQQFKGDWKKHLAAHRSQWESLARPDKELKGIEVERQKINKLFHERSQLERQLGLAEDKRQRIETQVLHSHHALLDKDLFEQDRLLKIHIGLGNYLRGIWNDISREPDSVREALLDVGAKLRQLRQSEEQSPLFVEAEAVLEQFKKDLQSVLSGENSSSIAHEASSAISDLIEKAQSRVTELQNKIAEREAAIHRLEKRGEA